MITRYYCGNGDGMFESPTGSYVTFEDHQKLLLEVAKMAHVRGSEDQKQWIQWKLNETLDSKFDQFKQEIL